VIEGLASRGATVSIDTMKPEVAQRALQTGATILNDVNALGSPGMAEFAAQSGCTVCLMHMRGNPRTMQQNPTYEDVVAEVRDYLLERAEFAISKGIAKDNIWIDPGIGFGKTVEHNLRLLAHLDQLVATGYPVLIGVSRKSFIGKLLSDPPLPTNDRMEGTLAAQVIAQMKGAKIIRAHDVKQSRRAIDMTAAISE
jgi:dihydropteroate synthase